MARGRPSKKQHILDTAQALFAQLGYQGTSIDLVVRQAAVSKPTVYNNFPSKQSLLLTLIHNSTSELKQQLELIVHSDGSLSQQLMIGFNTISQSAFLRAVFRISYGERHKLDLETTCAIDELDDLLSKFCHSIFHQKTIPDTQRTLIEALCRQGIIINSLNDRTQLQQPELDKFLDLLIPRYQ